MATCHPVTAGVFLRNGSRATIGLRSLCRDECTVCFTTSARAYGGRYNYSKAANQGIPLSHLRRRERSNISNLLIGNQLLPLLRATGVCWNLDTNGTVVAIPTGLTKNACNLVFGTSVGQPPLSHRYITPLHRHWPVLHATRRPLENSIGLHSNNVAGFPNHAEC